MKLHQHNGGSVVDTTDAPLITPPQVFRLLDFFVAIFVAVLVATVAILWSNLA